jgi:DNA-binding XRE family transcriptional regulator
MSGTWGYLKETDMDIRERWMEWRERMGYTQEVAADTLGISRSAIGSFECGRSYPKGVNLLKIVEVLYELGPRGNGTPAGSYHCPRCGEGVPGPEDGACYCSGCGAKQGVRCPACGAGSRLGVKFCATCGGSMEP